MEMRVALAGLVGLLLGSIPFSWIVGRLFGGLDIRSIGSGNVGATNVARSLGYGAGLVALLLDAAKGAAAVLVARLLAPGPSAGSAALWAGGMAVLGHNFTPFLRLRGGKGVATGAGVFAVIAPGALLAAVFVFAAALAIGRMVSLGSVLAAATLPAAAWLLHADRGIVILALLTAALVIARHRANLSRIARGAERRLGDRAAG